MDATDDPSMPTGLGSVVVNGIQDVSAFLPLLGTDQCESHSTEGLERGFWYVAATPLSIFGSLGILKAGFITLILSIDIPRFRGPRLIHNAGFAPDGLLNHLMYVNDTDDSISVAEQKVRTILEGRRPIEVVPNLYSKAWMWWNFQMLGWTITLSGLGLLPYVYIITHDIGHRPFSLTWMYPLFRVAGSALTATMIQLVIQLRILTIVRHCSAEGDRRGGHFFQPIGIITARIFLVLGIVASAIGSIGQHVHGSSGLARPRGCFYDSPIWTKLCTFNPCIPDHA